MPKKKPVKSNKPSETSNSSTCSTLTLDFEGECLTFDSKEVRSWRGRPSHSGLARASHFVLSMREFLFQVPTADGYAWAIHRDTIVNRLSAACKGTRAIPAEWVTPNRAVAWLARNGYPSPAEFQTTAPRVFVEGEWSIPTSLAKLGSALGGHGPKKTKTILKRFGLKEAGNRQTWTVRLDLMPTNMREKIEQGVGKLPPTSR